MVRVVEPKIDSSQKEKVILSSNQICDESINAKIETTVESNADEKPTSGKTRAVEKQESNKIQSFSSNISHQLVVRIKTHYRFYGTFLTHFYISRRIFQRTKPR